MQCGEAVVPVSWLVEQVVLVFLLRTDKNGKDELRSGVSNTLGHTRSKATT